MSKNKLYTCSYFCKRIIEQGFDVIRLNIPYEKDDLRKWSIVVNKHNSAYKINVMITCFKNEETKNFEFQFQGQRKKAFFLSTLTMTMIINILKRALSDIDETEEIIEEEKEVKEEIKNE